VRRVLLVGLVAAGKSAVLEAVAGATGWPCMDDALVLERSAGRSAASLLADGGQAALRTAESHVLTLTLSMPPPLVATLPAAVVLEASDRRRLGAGGHVVWLRASVPTLMRRMAEHEHPTVPDGDPGPLLQELARSLEPLYAEVANQVVDTDRLTPVQAARQVVSAARLSVSG
jgi:shikimate kinase